jgi:hypothetical protein
MNRIINLFTWILLIMSGCGVTENESIPEFESYLKAEINGESWRGDSPRAAFTFIEDDSLFQVFASEFDSVLYPYNKHLGFTFFYEQEKNSYSVLRKNEKHGKSTGALYVEKDGDAVIAWYYPIKDSLNSFTTELKKDEFGRRYTEGSFALKVAVDPDYDRPNNNQYRQQPDTVLITAGKYKVLVEE